MHVFSQFPTAQLSSAARWFMLVLALMIAGCGGEDDGRRPVSGTVTLDGSPLPSGTVGLLDAEGNPGGVGMINDGEFSITQSSNISGTMPGTYQVSVESWEQEPGEVLADGSMAEGKLATPEKYRNPQTSGLTIEVPEGGVSGIQLELTSE